MASDSPEQKQPPQAELQSMLARLQGMMNALGAQGEGEDDDLLPSFDFPQAPSTPRTVTAGGVPLAMPIASAPVAAPPLAEPIFPIAEPTETMQMPAAEAVEEPPTADEPPAPLPPCAICGSLRTPGQASCHDCGFHFPDDLPAAAAPLAASAAVAPAAALSPNPGHSRKPPGAAVPLGRIKQRYELLEFLGERKGVSRYRARDLGLTGSGTVAVIVIKQAAGEAPFQAVPTAAPVGDDDDILPSFDFPGVASAPQTEVLGGRPAWPGVGWERNLLDTLQQPGLPVVTDNFTEGGFEYLVEEVPTGRSLWDLWDDPESNAQARFSCLARLAELLQLLHKAGAMLEGIRPDLIVVDDQGRPWLTDLADLLPLPVPGDAPVRGTLYTAPELLASPATADARAALYSFGGLLYSLHVGRELSEVDFNKPGQPKPFIPQFPDIHPAFGRLMHKTFMRQIDARFPSDEAVKEDKTGFAELIRTLRTLGRTLDNVRLEIAAWTTTGMVRTGNEDACSVLYSCETRQDDTAECALLLLADGMGGYEAGEIAASMCLSTLRKNMAALKVCSGLAGGSGFAHDLPLAEGNPPRPVDVEELKAFVKGALKDANKTVFQASRSGIGRRGMGCTAEVVYVDGRNIVVGHVGDSRTYHLHEGRLIQMTRDQTLVNRLVELGTLTPEEAEDHPRKNELQQAVGGQPDVEPGIYSGVLKPGDLVVVCSDGLSNHVKDLMLKQFLQNEGYSAELSARRLVNLVNIEGATDNATVIVVRVT